MKLRIKATPRELITLANFRGVYTEVARKLGVTPQHVRYVALGQTTSKRVSAELDRAIRRRRARVEKAA